MSDDALRDAKELYGYAVQGDGPETSEQAALAGILAGIIALVERLDSLTDDEGALHINAGRPA